MDNLPGMEEAPWWLIPALTFASVALAQGVVVLLFFARQKAEDERRWHERRLESYAAIVRAARDGFNAVNVIEGDVDSIDWASLSEAMGRVDECSLDIALLSSDPVREEAEKVRTILEMFLVLDPQAAGYPSPASLLSARYELEIAVRKELRIKTPRSLKAQPPDIEPPDPDEMERREP